MSNTCSGAWHHSIAFHRGKGAKDRFITLPHSTQHVLRSYWKTHRSRDAPAGDGRRWRGTRNLTWMFLPPSSTNEQRPVKAYQHLPSGSSRRPSAVRLQKFLGHKNLQTTLIYLHLTDPKEEDGRLTHDHMAHAGTLFEDMFPPQPPIDPPAAPEDKADDKPPTEPPTESR